VTDEGLLYPFCYIFKSVNLRYITNIGGINKVNFSEKLTALLYNAEDDNHPT